MIRVLAVDDEPPALRELAYLLERDERVGRVHTATNAASARAVIDGPDTVDAVFLDISMPGPTGVDLARSLRSAGDDGTRLALVFVTAHDDHVAAAFDLGAVDYVMKPFRTDRVRAAIGRAVQACASGPTAPAAPGQTGAPARAGAGDAVAVELGGVTRMVRLADISSVEAQGDYARLHTATGTHLLRVPLSVLEDQWAEAGFVRTHRSHLVALAHLEQVRSDQGRWSVLVAGESLPVSRRHARHLRDLLLRHAPRPTSPT